MSFGFNEGQEMLHNMVTRFVRDVASSAAIRSAGESADGYDPAIWRGIVDLGLAALAVPERLGGAGLGQIEQSIVLGAIGGALLPSPLLGTSLATRAILMAGSSAQQERWLPAIANGSSIATLALGWQGAASSSGDIALRVVDGAATLSGQAVAVPHGHVADLLIVAAHDGQGAACIAAIPRSRAGLSAERAPYIDLSRAVAKVRFENVAVAEDELFPVADDQVLSRLLAHANAGLAAELLESAKQALASTVDYASQRIQFGRPIGSFQALKHILADVAVAVEAAESAVWYAAAAADQRPEEFVEAAAVAKLLASTAATRAAAEMIQVHGGIGFTWEHDAHLRLRHARAASGLFGGPDAQKAIIFAAMSEDVNHAA